MFNRRRFLQTALVTAMVPPGLGVGIDTAFGNGVATRILATGGCPDAARFLAAAGAAAEHAEADVAELVTGLMSASDDAAALFGLTRDSDYVPLRQIALERGYRDIYLGRHQYRGGGLHHTVNAETDIADSLSRSLAAAGGRWAGALAEARAAVIGSSGLVGERRAHVPVARPRNSLGSMVSWAMGRV